MRPFSWVTYSILDHKLSKSIINPIPASVHSFIRAFLKPKFNRAKCILEEGYWQGMVIKKKLSFSIFFLAWDFWTPSWKRYIVILFPSHWVVVGTPSNEYMLDALLDSGWGKLLGVFTTDNVFVSFNRSWSNQVSGFLPDSKQQALNLFQNWLLIICFRCHWYISYRGSE